MELRLSQSNTKYLEWPKVQLSSITAFITKGSTPTTYGFRWENDGVLFLRSECVSENGLDLSQSMFISEKAHSVLKRSEIANGDILITITGNVGRVVLLDETFPGGNINQHIARIRISSPKVDNRFVYQFMSQHAVRRFFNSITTGQAYPQISLKQVREFQIPIPSTRAEQIAIATALSDADALITSLEKLIEKKRLIKQGVMQELLRPKEGWVQRRLRECSLCAPSYGINAAAVPYTDALPTYIRITDISDTGQFLPESRTSVDHPLSKNYFLEDGDVLFARTGASVGKTYLYSQRDGALVYAGFLIRVRVDQRIIHPKILKIQTETNVYRNWVKVMSMRSGQPGINGNEYGDLILNLPPMDEQKKIVKIFNDMEEELGVLEKKVRKYEAIKKAMMQELLTGKTRLVSKRSSAI